VCGDATGEDVARTVIDGATAGETGAADATEIDLAGEMEMGEGEEEEDEASGAEASGAEGVLGDVKEVFAGDSCDTAVGMIRSCMQGTDIVEDSNEYVSS
jgi:hypothetical protein